MIETVANTKLSIDKSTWEPVTFGDVVEEVRESVKDPEAEGLTRIIGLEHIESENIHINSWGSIEEGSSFSKRFRKGQLLFGRRRAYLKKAALATFDGICSGDIIVMQAKKGLVPELLPFLVNNDKFFEYAVKTSAGSLSPRTKFKDLANYEFLLPPKDKQAQLAELLWAMDEVIEREYVLLQKLEDVKFIECLSSFMNGISVNRAGDIILPNEHWKLVPIKKVVPDIEYGISISIPKNQDDSAIPIISTAEIDREGNLDYSIIRSVRYEKMNERVTLKTGDVLFNWRNTAELIGKTAIFEQPEHDDRPHTFASFLLRLRCDEVKMHNKYLMQLMNFYRISEIFLGLARKAVNQANFNKNEVGDLLIPVPPYEVQLFIMNRLNKIEENKVGIKNKLSSSRALQKSLINQIL